MPNLRKMRLPGRRPGRVPRPIRPRGIELTYFGELRKMIARLRALIADRLLPALPDLLERAAVARGDGSDLVANDPQPGLSALPRYVNDAHPARRINTLIDGIARSLANAYPQERLERLAERVARATSEHQKTQLFRQIRSLTGVELSTMADRKLTPRIKQFTAENVALIRSVPRQALQQVEVSVLAGMRAGTRAEDLAGEIEERLGVSESRAALIARDQILKFHGELDQARQEDLGIEQYVWRTVEDNRVRKVHEERDGEIFRWDDPPGDPDDPEAGGHPGRAINCRCYAQPITADLIAGADST